MREREGDKERIGRGREGGRGGERGRERERESTNNWLLLLSDFRSRSQWGGGS